MKKIKIFLASSIEELHEDRLEMSTCASKLKDIYAERGVDISYKDCSNFDPAISEGGKQAEYDEWIRESALCIFLFFRKVGEHTRHEFDVALEHFRECGKPRILTFFRDLDFGEEASAERLGFVGMLSDIKHYYIGYSHIDTVKFYFSTALQRLENVKEEYKIAVGVNNSLFSIANVPLINNNKNYIRLREKEQELEEKVSNLKKLYAQNLEDDEIENEFFSARSELKETKAARERAEHELMKFATTVAELTSDGSVVTHRQKRALELFNSGDYKSAKTILDGEEREQELARAEARLEQGKNEIQGYIEESLLWIKAARVEGVDKHTTEEIIRRYERATELAEKHNLDKWFLYDYAEFLFAGITCSDCTRKAKEIAEKLHNHYAGFCKEGNDFKMAKLKLLLAEMYEDDDCPQKFIKRTEECIAITKKIFHENVLVHGKLLARAHAFLWRIYYDIDKEKALSALLNALEVRKEMAKINAEEYGAELASTLVQLAPMYDEKGEHKKAEEMYSDAIKTYEWLLANVQYEQEQALVIDKALTRAYMALALIYEKTKQFSEGEKALLSAIAVYEQMVEEIPKLYIEELERAYDALISIYKKQGKTEKAREAAIARLAASYRVMKLDWEEEAEKKRMKEELSLIGAQYAIGRGEMNENLLRQEISDNRALVKLEPNNNMRKFIHAHFSLIMLHAAQGTVEIKNLLEKICHDAIEEIEGVEKVNFHILDKKTKIDIEVFKECAPIYCGINLKYIYERLIQECLRTHKYKEAEELHLKILEIDRQLTERSPEKFERELSHSTGELGCFYEKMGEYEKAEQMYLESFNIILRQGESLDSTLELAYERLGKIYIALKCYEKAETNLMEVLKYAEERQRKQPGRFKNHVASVYYYLSKLYYESKQYDKGRVYIDKALALYRELVKDSPKNFSAQIKHLEAWLAEM